MNRLAIKKQLYAGLGDYARQKRGEALRKKYSTGNPQLDAVAASQDEAVEAAQVPAMPKKMPDMSGADVSDVPSGADAAGPAMDDAMAAMAEDEEMAKWMAKQKG